MQHNCKTLLSTAAALSLALAVPVASAMDIGLGVTVQNEGGGNGGWGASLPLRFGNIMVEPELSFYHNSDNQTYPTSPSSNRKYDNTEYTLDTGIYLRQHVTAAVDSYLGGRIGYNHSRYSYKYPNSPSSNYTDVSTGPYIGPTIGAEYFFDKHFTIGLDVSLLYTSSSGKETQNGAVTNKQDGNQFDYQTRARLRYYF